MVCALQALDCSPTRVLAKSRLFQTPFVPSGAGPDVINAVALIATDLAPAPLLAHLHAIEAEFDRTRTNRWGDRTLDLDLLSMDDLVLPDQPTFLHWQEMSQSLQRTRAPDRLILPHPRLQDRGFVLVPAADVAAAWRHPVLGRTIGEMLADLPPDEVAAIRPVCG